MRRRELPLVKMKRHFSDTKFYKTLMALMKRKIAVAGLAVCVLNLFLMLSAPAVSPYDPSMTDTDHGLQSPSLAHLFGTDDLGRDVMSRVIYGARLTMSVSVVSVLIALSVGTLLGLVSGYFGGKLDLMINMVIEGVSAFPMVIFGLVMAAILGPGLFNVTIAIGLAYIPAFARIVRSMVLTVKEREYIEGAVSIGLNSAEILWHYILPNIFSAIIVQTSLCAANAILSEASLSFLGLGVQAPQASWGSMLKNGYDYISVAPWLSIFPGLAILLTVLALNFLGDGLRDALDVKIRTN